MSSMLRRSTRNRNEENAKLQRSTLSMPSSPTRKPFQRAEAITNSAVGTTMKSKNTAKSTNTNSTTFVNALLKPVVGARCAVYFEQTKDFFGDKRQAQGWFPATIERVQANGSKLTARFDDNTKEENLSVSEIRLLRQEGTKLYWNINGRDEVFCETRPENLDPGDLVMGYYQNGGNNDAWYRGRIAVTGLTKEGIKVCDVAYDDGDYEMAIPYGAEHSNITVLQRGTDHPEWLKGLQIDFFSKKPKTAIVLSAMPKQHVQIQYNERKGNEDGRKNKSYTAVAKAVMAKAKDGVAKEKLFQWPWHVYAMTDAAPSPAKKNKPSVTSNTAEAVPPRKRTKPPGRDEDENSAKEEGETIKKGTSKGKAVTSKKKKAPTKKTPAEESSDEELIEDMVASRKDKKKAASKTPKRAAATRNADASSDEEYVEDMVIASRAKANQKAAPKKAPRAKTRASESAARKTTASTSEEAKAVLEPSSYWEIVDADPPLQTGRRPFVPMSSSLAHTFGKALNSSDCDLGAQLLTHMLSMHHNVPNDELWITLMDLNTHGPKSGSTCFADCYRMDLSMMYLRLLFSLEGQLNICSELVGRDLYATKHGGSTYLETFLTQMSAVYYMAEGDEARTNKWAVDRICQSLHARNCFAEIFLAILKFQLKSFVSNTDDDDGYRSKPVVRDIVRARRGAKDAFERAVTACVQHWLLYGHFILFGDGIMTEPDENAPDRDAVNCLQGQATLLANHFGTIISYFGALYAKEANEDVDALADIISKIVFLEIEDCKFDNQHLLGEISREEFLWRFKLRFLTKLESPLVPNLKPKLADRLGIAEQYNIIFG